MLSLGFHQTNSVFAVLLLLMVHLSRLIWHLSLVLICAQMWLSPVAGRHLSEPRKMGVTCLCFFLHRAIKMLPIFLQGGATCPYQEDNVFCGGICTWCLALGTSPAFLMPCLWFLKVSDGMEMVFRTTSLHQRD